jgi:ABC-type glycerol-3-phosphate transport system substrate-binding protein
MPKDWAEWLSQLKKLSVDTNGDGVKDQYGLGLAAPGFFMNEEVYMWVGSNGGRLFDEKGRPTFTEKPVIEMLEFYKALNDCCLWPGWLNHGYPETFTMLAQGKVAAILGWGRGAVEFEKYSPQVVKNNDIGVYTAKPVGPSGKEYLTQLDSEPWMVFKDSRYPEEAVAFLKFFYKPENHRRYIQSVPIHFFPITKSMQNDPIYLKQTPEFKTWRFWVEAQESVIAAGRARPLLMTQWDDLKLPYINEIAGSAILVDMVTDVVTGARSPMEAAKRAQERAEALIKDLGFKRW